MKALDSRYARHYALPGFGPEAQQTLADARVLLIGAGGLGCPALQYLAAAGVGHIGIVDADTVAVHNLQRQVLYRTEDLGRAKATCAADWAHALNPDIAVTAYPLRLTSANALKLLKGYDLVLDGSDNFPTRYLVNDACVLLGLPLVYAAVFQYEGQLAVFNGRDDTGAPTANYRCLFPEPPVPGTVPDCAEGGVLGALTGILGSWQALEAIKLLTGIGEPLLNRLLTLDARTLQTRLLTLAHDPDNPLNGTHPRQTGLIDYEAFCGLQADTPGTLSWAALTHWPTTGKPYQLLDVREDWERALGHLGGTHIPLAALPARLGALDPQQTWVTYCARGTRARSAAELLRSAGFADVWQLEGGTDPPPVPLRTDPR